MAVLQVLMIAGITFGGVLAIESFDEDDLLKGIIIVLIIGAAIAALVLVPGLKLTDA